MLSMLRMCVCVCLHQAGMGGHYVLDEYGDRDVNLSMIYTSAVTGKVRPLPIQRFAQSDFEPTIFLARKHCCVLKSQCKGENVFLYFVFLQYKTLSVFDTSRNKTVIIETNPTLPWKGGELPPDVPENPGGKTHIHTDGGGLDRDVVLPCSLKTVNNIQLSFSPAFKTEIQNFKKGSV